MSVSQVKKRFEEFEKYLGKDKEGLRRLKLLKDDVNVLRWQLADAQEKQAAAESIKDEARNRADDAQKNMKELSLEVERLTATNKQLMHTNSMLNDEVSKRHDRERIPFATGNLVDDLLPERIRRWVGKTIREQGGTLKKRVRSPSLRTYGWELCDVLTGFDEYGFATLGRTVVLTLLFTKSVAVFWNEDEQVDFEKIHNAIWKQPGADNAMRAMRQMFAHEVDLRSPAEVLAQKTSGKSLFPTLAPLDYTSILFGDK